MQLGATQHIHHGNIGHDLLADLVVSPLVMVQRHRFLCQLLWIKFVLFGPGHHTGFILLFFRISEINVHLDMFTGTAG